MVNRFVFAYEGGDRLSQLSLPMNIPVFEDTSEFDPKLLLYRSSMVYNYLGKKVEVEYRIWRISTYNDYDYYLLKDAYTNLVDFYPPHSDIEMDETFAEVNREIDLDEGRGYTLDQFYGVVKFTGKRPRYFVSPNGRSWSRSLSRFPDIIHW